MNSFFASIRARLDSIWSNVTPAVLAAEHFLQTVLTKEHIAAGEAAVVAVKDKSLTGFQKAEEVAGVLQAIPDLNPEAHDAIGAVVGALALVAKAKGLIK